MNTTHSSNSNPHSQLTLAGRQRNLSLHELEAWMPSTTEAISPALDQLMLHMEPWCCITGEEFAVELALREALSNAVIHGNRGDPNKVVEIRCSGQRGRGIRVIVRDEGEGFDPSAVPSPLTEQGLVAEHGRGIHLMKSLMDEVSFQCGGREVHMKKSRPANQRKDCQRTSTKSHQNPLAAPTLMLSLPNGTRKTCQESCRLIRRNYPPSKLAISRGLRDTGVRGDLRITAKT